MKRKFTLYFILLLSICAFSIITKAQTVFRSTASGSWKSFTIWQVSTTGPTGTYSPAPDPGASAAMSGINYPNQTTDVIIQNSNTVTLDATYAVRNLTINSGGTLQSDGSARILRLYGSSSGPVIVTNNGLLGGVTTGPDNIALESYTDVSLSNGFTLTGTGNTRVSRIRTAGISRPIAVVIDQNVTLSQTANYALTAIYSPTANDNVTITINAGKTVTLSSATGYFNSNSGSAFGNYTYNINGTLDLSANTGVSNISQLQPLGSGSSVTLNVNGLLKAGSFTTSTNSGASGTLALNINNGGVFDATTSGATYNLNTALPFATQGTGVLRRTVASTDVVFPLINGSSMNSVTINNTGTSDNFSVNVKNTFDETPPSSKRVDRQWIINEGTAGGTSATLKFAWTTADQTAGFTTASPVYIYHYNGSVWDATLATVTGSGTTADPYVATASGFTSFSPFAIGNDVTLPVSFINNKAFTQANGVQVQWTTAFESGISNFVIERSADGRNFTNVGSVAINRDNNYSWFDAAPFSGVNYYRIKSTELSGAAKYTSIMKVTTGKKGAEMVIASNPVKGGLLSLQLSGMEKGIYNLTLFNNAGQQVFAKSISVEGGSLSQGIQMPRLSGGLYSVQLRSNSMALTKSIVIE